MKKVLLISIGLFFLTFGLKAVTYPLVPTGLTATSIVSDKAVVAWDVTAGAETYNFYMDSVLLINTQKTTVEISGMAIGVSYIFNVASVGLTATSALSASLTITAGSEGAPPRDVQDVRIVGGLASISVTASSNITADTSSASATRNALLADLTGTVKTGNDLSRDLTGTARRSEVIQTDTFNSITTQASVIDTISLNIIGWYGSATSTAADTYASLTTFASATGTHLTNIYGSITTTAVSVLGIQGHVTSTAKGTAADPVMVDARGSSVVAYQGLSAFTYASQTAATTWTGGYPNPSLIYGIDTLGRARVPIMTTSGILNSSISNSFGTSNALVGNVTTDGLSTTNFIGLFTASLSHLYNGTSIDRWHSNLIGSTWPNTVSGAATVSQVYGWNGTAGLPITAVIDAFGNTGLAVFQGAAGLEPWPVSDTMTAAKLDNIFDAITFTATTATNTFDALTAQAGVIDTISSNVISWYGDATSTATSIYASLTTTGASVLGIQGHVTSTAKGTITDPMHISQVANIKTEEAVVAGYSTTVGARVVVDAWSNTKFVLALNPNTGADGSYGTARLFLTPSVKTNLNIFNYSPGTLFVQVSGSEGTMEALTLTGMRQIAPNGGFWSEKDVAGTQLHWKLEAATETGGAFAEYKYILPSLQGVSYTAYPMPQ